MPPALEVEQSWKLNIEVSSSEIGAPLLHLNSLYLHAITSYLSRISV